jgi:phosphoglycolate phosphatase-like HAD superfamily hydrolase
MTHIVMFDVDGTLVDSAGFDGALFASAVRSVLDADVDETWQSYRNVTDSGVLEEILEQQPFARPIEELRRAVKQRFVELVRDHVESRASAVREIRGARSFVESLRAQPGIRVAIATGGWAETALLKLQAIGVSTEGLAFASASDHVQRTSIMRFAEERASAGTAASRKTYFGDAQWDKRASAELGYAFVAIGNGVSHDVSFDDFTDDGRVFAHLGVGI